MIAGEMSSSLALARRPVATADAAEQRPGIVKIGLALAYLSAVMTPWTGITFGTATVSDYVLLLAAAALLGAALGHRLPTLPPWVWAMALAVLVTGVVNQFDPPSDHYMMMRDLPVGNAVTHVVTTRLTNIVVMIPLLGRILLLPLVFGLARGYDPRVLRRAALAFVGGAAISALIAFSDSKGFTSIGPSVTGVGVAAGRAAGLTKQTNVVAMGCVIALPLAVWQTQTGRGRRRLWAVLAVIALLLGLYASRSRSGAAAAVVAGIVALAWLPQYRRHLPTVAFGGALTLAILFAVSPSAGESLLKQLRLTGSDASASDRVRGIVNTEAWHDFLYSPLHGIGLRVADTAHVIYLQALAVGGLILLGGLVAYQLGALTRCVRLARRNPLAIAFFVSVLGEIIFNSEQNALTPSLAYFVPSLAAALPLTAARGHPVPAGPGQASRASTSASTRSTGMETSS